MARRGSFGSSLNPFGTGSFGGLSSYNIGDNLKDLAAYQAEIAWGNGQLSDAQYQASLAGLVAAADPGTQTLLSAQNKLDDVTYRIGRSEADAVGLDALIAFDQQTLAGMNPDNVRYRDVKANLDSELAQRRSRDYGKIVDDYNAGLTSTESLMAWVQNTLASLPADAPDADNWASVASSLTERLVSERDAQVYQDYQDRKMAPADFLAYLTGRRDAFDPSSPKWAEADRRLQDAETSVKNTALAAQDQAFFNLYSLGKKSDASYLLYLNRRVAGLAPDDPTLPEWKHRLTQAAHSIAEDKLRHEVATATTDAGEATARKNLRSFYEAYARTLNPGSSEYRTIEERILALKPRPVSTGGGGGGGGGGTPKGKVVVDPKVIPSTGSFDAILTLLTPDATAPKKDQAVAVKALELNLDSARDAANDKVWLYHDPRYPGQMVTRRNPDGTLWRDPVTKKTMKVPGTAYRPTSSDEEAAMEVVTANYSFALAGIALYGGVVGGKVVKGGDFKTYWTRLRQGNNALDAARTTQAHAVQRDITAQLKAIDQGIDIFTKLNDPATVVNLLFMKRDKIEAATKDTRLDQDQLKALNGKADEIWDNPLFPLYQTDMAGNKVRDAAGNFIQDRGAVDVANSPRAADQTLIPGTAVRRPGWHFLLDTNSRGEPVWGDVWEDPQKATWARNIDGSLNHVTVRTGIWGTPVSGEVKVSRAPVKGLWVTNHDGFREFLGISVSAEYFSFVDGYGNRVNGYSVDGGKTWVQATGGHLPALELNGQVTITRNADGTVTVTRDDDGTSILADSGGLIPNLPISWYGQIAAMGGPGDVSAGVGAPGQRFRLVFAEEGPDGPVLNLTPNDILMAENAAERLVARARDTFAAGAAPGATLAEESAAVRTRGLVPAERARMTREALFRDAAAADSLNVFAAGVAPGATLAEESAAIRGRGLVRVPSPAFDAGTLVSTLATAVQPALTGIISLGATMLAAVVPPLTSPILRSLYEPPVLKPVSTAPPKAPSRIYEPPAPAPKVTAPSRIYEPPAPVVKKVTAPKPPPAPVRYLPRPI